MKTERHGSSQIVMKMSSQYLFSRRLVAVMCLLLRAGKLRSPLLPYQRRGGKVSLDAGICGLMQILPGPQMPTGSGQL